MFETFLSHILKEICYTLTKICLHRNPKAYLALTLNVMSILYVLYVYVVLAYDFIRKKENK